MKKFIFPVLMVVMPIMIFAGVFDRFVRPAATPKIDFSRSFRVNEQVISSSIDGNWIPGSKAEMHYNAANSTRIDSITVKMWDGELSEWSDTVMRSQFLYNANGLVVESNFDLMYFGEPMPFLKNIAVYDAQNRLTDFYMYNVELFRLEDFWIPQTRMHIIYGPGTTFELYTWEIGDESERIPYYTHTTFDFDAAGRVIEDISYTSADSTAWVQSDRSVTSYHPQDTSTGADYIQFIANNLALMLTMDYYEEPGKILTETGYWWDGANWQYSYKTENQFDTALLMSETLESWYSTDTWQPTDKTMYHYDTNNNKSYEISQYYEMGGFIDSERIDFAWENYTSNDDMVNPVVLPISVSAYPVPFKDSVTISASSKSSEPITFGIYNAKGQLVRKLKTEASQTVNWDGKDAKGMNATAGVYFIRASQNQDHGLTRIIKLK